MKIHAVSIVKTGLANGLVLGGVLSFLVFVIAFFNYELFTRWWVGASFFALTVAAGIFSIAKAKKLLNAFISFRQAFGVYFGTVALGLFIGMLSGILVFVVFDPGLADSVAEKNIELTHKFVTEQGGEAEEMEVQASAIANENTLWSQVKSYFYALGFTAVLGLPIALFFRRKAPDDVV